MPMVRLSDEAHATVKKLAERKGKSQQEILDWIIEWYERMTK